MYTFVCVIGVDEGDKYTAKALIVIGLKWIKILLCDYNFFSMQATDYQEGHFNWIKTVV